MSGEERCIAWIAHHLAQLFSIDPIDPHQIVIILKLAVIIGSAMVLLSQIIVLITLFIIVVNVYVVGHCLTGKSVTISTG